MRVRGQEAASAAAVPATTAHKFAKRWRWETPSACTCRRPRGTTITLKAEDERIDVYTALMFSVDNHDQQTAMPASEKRVLKWATAVFSLALLTAVVTAHVGWQQFNSDTPECAEEDLITFARHLCNELMYT